MEDEEMKKAMKWISLATGAALVLLAGGCETSGSGGNDDVQWSFNSGTGSTNNTVHVETTANTGAGTYSVRN